MENRDFIHMEGRRMNGKVKNWKAGLVILGILFMSGCVTGPAVKLQATPGFVPKKVYQVSYDQMWDKVVSVLKNNGIDMIFPPPNRESMAILTQLTEGWSVDVPAISTETYAIRYYIAFKKINPQQTQVDITCDILVKKIMEGGNAAELTQKLQPFAHTMRGEENTRLELWLYEQIEKTL